MKGSEASSLALILSSLCLVPVSLRLPRWLGTITSQRYFLNVSSGAERFPVGGPGSQGPRAGPPWSTMRSRDTRERLAALQGRADAGVNHCSQVTLTVSWMFIWISARCFDLDKNFWSNMKVYSSHRLPPRLSPSQIGSCVYLGAPPPRAYHELMTTSHTSEGEVQQCVSLFSCQRGLRHKRPSTKEPSYSLIIDTLNCLCCLIMALKASPYQQ